MQNLIIFKKLLNIIQQEEKVFERKHLSKKIIYLSGIIAIFIIIGCFCFAISQLMQYSHYPFFHVLSLGSIIIALACHVQGFGELQTGKTQKQLEMERWRGIVILLFPVFIAIGCSILNSAYLGETKLNKQILGFFLCTYPLILVFIFSGYIEHKMNKSDNIHDKLNDQQEKITSDVIHAKLMLERLGIAHNYAYTIEQFFALDKAGLSLGSKVWKRKQVKLYFEIIKFSPRKRISDIKEIKKKGSKTEYIPRLVEKYAMPNLNSQRQSLYKEFKTISKNN